MTPTSLDLELVRSHFPALQNGFVFLDNAGGSQTLKGVADRISEYLLTSDVQHGATYSVSQLAKQRVTGAQQRMAKLLGAADPGEVVVGPSATNQFRMLARSLAKTWSPGDEVIITNAEHEANASPWRELEEQGIVIKVWQVDPESLSLRLDDLEPLMTSRTRLVTFTHASNLLGTIHPVKEIAEFVHARKALVAVDGVAYAPHRLIDFRDLGVDFYVFSCYKVYGPHQGILLGKRELLVELPGHNHYFIKKDDLPYKFQPGGTNYESTYGLNGLVDYLVEIARNHGWGGEENDVQGAGQYAFDLFARHEEALTARLLDYLHQKPGIRVFGEPSANRNKRVATVSFVMEGRDSREVVSQVDPHQIGLRFGDFYAKKLIDPMGVNPESGVIRASMVHYNTMEEMDRLIAVLDQVL